MSRLNFLAKYMLAKYATEIGTFSEREHALRQQLKELYENIMSKTSYSIFKDLYLSKNPQELIVSTGDKIKSIAEKSFDKDYSLEDAFDDLMFVKQKFDDKHSEGWVYLKNWLSKRYTNENDLKRILNHIRAVDGAVKQRIESIADYLKVAPPSDIRERHEVKPVTSPAQIDRMVKEHSQELGLGSSWEKAKELIAKMKLENPSEYERIMHIARSFERHPIAGLAYVQLSVVKESLKKLDRMLSAAEISEKEYDFRIKQIMKSREKEVDPILNESKNKIELKKLYDLISNKRVITAKNEDMIEKLERSNNLQLATALFKQNRVHYHEMIDLELELAAKLENK